MISSNRIGKSDLPPESPAYANASMVKRRRHREVVGYASCEMETQKGRYGLRPLAVRIQVSHGSSGCP